MTTASASITSPIAVSSENPPDAARLVHTLMPLLGAMLLDLADFFSLGPQGPVLGLLIGAPLGWWIASLLGLNQSTRLVAALAAAIYCAIPGTELLPLASIITLLTRGRVAQLAQANFSERS